MKIAFFSNQPYMQQPLTEHRLGQMLLLNRHTHKACQRTLDKLQRLSRNEPCDNQIN